MTADHPYRDLAHPYNGARYRTGEQCDCGAPAGTWWSRHWCVGCNIARIDRIGAVFDAAEQQREGRS